MERGTPIVHVFEHLDVLSELTLAHDIAVATLRYHSTSWLAPDWGLQDIFYFGDDAQMGTLRKLRELPKLYLGTQLHRKATNDTHQVPNNDQDLRDVHGIRNLPLAKLGVALLEIGFGREMEQMEPATPSPPRHTVITARRVLQNAPLAFARLGGSYLKIAEQCLHCDFACGDDLENEALREAVYTDVICRLETMLNQWKEFRGL
jgi:hypothetical protein